MSVNNQEQIPSAFREKVSKGEWQRSTEGVCPGYVQANLVILPAKFALDFTVFCLRNPRPCPILEVLEPGDPIARDMAADADIRTSLPGYRIFKNGEMAEERYEIESYWRDDLVTFLIGCSYTFEESLVKGGVPVRNYLEKKDPAVYISSVMCRSAGIFSGPMVVSMRPVSSSLVSRAVQITSRFPRAHGAPVYIGDGKAIGVSDISNVDFGEVPEIKEGEIPVFWGCGITPQTVALQSKVPFIITHKPCHMFVSDIRVEELAVS